MNFVLPVTRKLNVADELKASNVHVMETGPDAVYTEYTLTYEGKGWNPWYNKY
jgi:hypothetical protein